MNDYSMEIRLNLPLDRFDFEIDCVTEKRVVGIFGPSGSGKTTLLETIAGLRRTASGRLSFCGKVWMDSQKGIYVPPEKRGIGYVPQDQRLFPHLNVRQNLKFASGRNSNMRPQDASLDEVVDALELETLLEQPTCVLSGGERQRVALGRALCSGPSLLLLDEPLASLDIELRHRILPFLKRVRERFDLPLMIVSHQPLELQALCDEVLVIREGKLVAQGKSTEVFTGAACYSLRSYDGFENIVTAVHESSENHVSTMRIVGENTPHLLTFPTEAKIGDEIILGISAQDILIATHRVVGTSARNIIEGNIEQLQYVDTSVLVFVDIGGKGINTLVVDVTLDAMKELNLELGQTVFLLIKSSSVRVY
jgi:molybdate transport system ATP-binding protein